ncbi:iron complex outermembrane receptor protein [Pseudoduganella lurida]|uniref:Iron complex outermembrane receptor protein n=1 Tax=Pseudoduganella lurida TaxID=1036180 RepID=A0A562QWJ1_9BURK|nr:TonB-dependent receptor [Pseudoduganella lurida]TWI61201.1 iron complex outermembrane receptor protein [Pseudoduganella lurida]
MVVMNRRHGRPLPLTPVAAALALLQFALPAQAQQAQQAPATGSEPQLETIVVSANRRIEKLEDVPMSISVLTEEALTRNNVREFDDIVNLSPALTISTGTQVGTNSINMRGIGTTSNNIGIEGDVAIIVDDMPYAQAQQAFRDQSDVARVEVLKGPQSTMFGKSAIAGAVVITTKPIGAGPMKGKLSLFRSSDDEYRVATSASGRLSDTVGLRLFASKTNFPGLLHNLTTDRMQNGSGGKTFFAKLQWQVTPDLDVQISPRYDHALRTGNTAAITSIGPGVGYLYNRNYKALSNTAILRGINVSPFNTTIRNDSPTGLDASDRGIGVRINYLFPEASPLAGHALTSITSVDKNRSNDFRDNDNIDLISTFYQLDHTGKPSGIAEPPMINGTMDTKMSTQELRITSPDGGNFRYLAGLWLARTSIDRYYLRGNPLVKETNWTNYHTTSANLNRALYANGSWDFLPRHTLTAGLRFTRETNDYMFHTIDSLSSSAPNNVHTGSNLYTAPQHDENFVTGKLGYGYKLTRDTMVYGTASTGSKGVAYDMTSGANNVNVFKRLPLAPEKATSFEAGFKANLWNNRATLNLAVFKSTFRDYQTSATERFTDGSQASVLYSIPSLQTKGFEADASALLTRELLLTANLAYTRATVVDWKQGPCYSGATDCTVPNELVPGSFLRDASGGMMPNAPKWKMNLGGEYTLPFRAIPYKTAINANLRAQSQVQGAISQDPSLLRPGHAIVDLGASLASRDSRYKLAVGVKNLFDHHYAVGNVGSFLNFQPTTGPAIRSYGWQPARDAFRYYTARLDVNF